MGFWLHPRNLNNGRLDYIFASPNLVSQVESAAILKDEATDGLSDHTPVTATLRLP